jgi:hypothetical protein
MDHVHVPMLLPGITFDTSPTDYSPVKQMQLRRFDGARWVGFGASSTANGPPLLVRTLSAGQMQPSRYIIGYSGWKRNTARPPPCRRLGPDVPISTMALGGCEASIVALWPTVEKPRTGRYLNWPSQFKILSTSFT